MNADKIADDVLVLYDAVRRRLDAEKLQVPKVNVFDAASRIVAARQCGAVDKPALSWWCVVTC